MKTLQHRIIWWMVDIGAVGNILLHGWQVEAARQLAIHRITLYRQLELLVEKGIVIEGEKKGEVTLNPEIFKSVANARRIRMEKVVR
jgi:DNA-binding IclR family transcriptional regulator